MTRLYSEISGDESEAKRQEVRYQTCLQQPPTGHGPPALRLSPALRPDHACLVWQAAIWKNAQTAASALEQEMERLRKENDRMRGELREQKEENAKLKKEKGGPPALTFVENPDILATLSASGPARPKLVVGFAAETDHIEDHARAKLARKGCDWIIANDVTEPGVMGGTENAVLLVTRDGTERWDRAGKDEVAARIARRIAEALA